MDTQADRDRDAAAAYCRREHTEEHIRCDECARRAEERVCRDCDRHLLDREIIEPGHKDCLHDDVVDGFDRPVQPKLVGQLEDWEVEW